MEQHNTQTEPNPESIVDNIFGTIIDQNTNPKKADADLVRQVLTAEIHGQIEHNPIVEWTIDDEHVEETDDAYVIRNDYYGRYSTVEDSPHVDDGVHERDLKAAKSTASIVHDDFALRNNVTGTALMVTVVPKATVPDDYNVETGEFEK